MRRRVYWLLVVVLLNCCPWLPVSWGRSLGGRLGRLALGLRPREYERALRHLGWVWPTMSVPARKDFLAHSATMLGRNFFDMVIAPRLVADDHVFCSAAGEDEKFGELGWQLKRLSALGRGVILLTGHLGCWELLGARVAQVLVRQGLGPLGVVTGTIHNPPVDQLLQNRRRALGLQPMARDQGSRPLVEHLLAGKIAALLLDQKISDQDPVVEFFGRPAPTPEGMVRMALKYHIPILPVAMAWDEQEGRHVIQRLPVLNLVPAGADAELSLAESLEERVASLQGECQTALEELIRRNPGQWVWFHERWSNQGMEQ